MPMLLSPKALAKSGKQCGAAGAYLFHADGNPTIVESAGKFHQSGIMNSLNEDCRLGADMICPSPIARRRNERDGGITSEPQG